MTFDTGTWWLITIILTALLGCIGALVSRSIFKSLDEHSSDIKEVKETCLRKDVFEHNMLRLENKMDALTKFLMERRD